MTVTREIGHSVLGYPSMMRKVQPQGLQTTLIVDRGSYIRIEGCVRVTKDVDFNRAISTDREVNNPWTLGMLRNCKTLRGCQKRLDSHGTSLATCDPSLFCNNESTLILLPLKPIVQLVRLMSDEILYSQSGQNKACMRQRHMRYSWSEITRQTIAWNANIPLRTWREYWRVP